MSDEQAVAEAVPEAIPVSVSMPSPAPPHVVTVVVSAEDRLELENVSLKLQNVQLQLQIMQSDLQKALANRDSFVTTMRKKREQMLQKYGIDIACVQINDDGTVGPLTAPRTGV